MVIALAHNRKMVKELYISFDVSFDRSIVAVDASFEKIGGLNGTPVDIGDVSFSGKINMDGAGNALEATTDLRSTETSCV